MKGNASKIIPSIKQLNKDFVRLATKRKVCSNKGYTLQIYTLS